MTGSQIFSNFKESKEPFQVKLSYVRYTVYDQEFARSLRYLIQMSQAYSQKISVIGVDPASIPGEQFSLKCLPPVEVSCSFLRPAPTPKKAVKGVQESGGV